MRHWMLLVVLMGCASPASHPASSDPFPTEPLARVCDHVGSHFQRLPERRLDEVVDELERLDVEALRRRVCTTAVRQEASAGLALLADARDDRDLLADLADTWAEPLALAELARDEAGRVDPVARRHLAAAREILDGVAARTRDEPPRAVANVLPVVPGEPTDRDRRYAQDRAAIYERLFAPPPRRVATN